MVKVKVKRDFFQEAVRLMRISRALRELPGVAKAGVAMGTEKGKAVLEQTALMTGEAREASDADLIIAVEAESEEVGEDALSLAESLMASSPEKARPVDLLKAEVAVINVGLEAFAEALRAQGVQVIHVDWKVPAEGDPLLVELLKKMC